ncbi:MAG TPA: sugar transferase [Nitrospirae bacterium]|nr:sugar transferase [Nitrospirota bacterium]
MKRGFDIFCSALGLLIFLPLFILVAIVIRIESPGPVFFRQERLGLGFRPFRLFKFRSMTVDAEKHGPSVTSGGDKRVTGIGKVLRNTKIDELPQLINVLLGDMSLVGPRPEVRKYVEMFKEDYERILSIRPGITDYAAIEYRDEEGVLQKAEDTEKCYVELVLPLKIKLYKKYLDNRGFITDLKLIILTLGVIAGVQIKGAVK